MAGGKEVFTYRRGKAEARLKEVRQGEREYESEYKGWKDDS